jgi:hypothetical protein
MVMNAINKIGNTNVEEETETDKKPIRTTGMGGGNLWKGPQSGTGGNSGNGGNGDRRKWNTMASTTRGKPEEMEHQHQYHQEETGGNGTPAPVPPGDRRK